MFTSLPDPFSTLLALQRALESRFDSGWLGGTTAGIGAFPQINVFQQDEDFVAVAELPGIDKANLHIEARDSAIRIHGTKATQYGEKISIHRRERLFGDFDRTISLPVQIDAEGIRADYRDGVLAIFIPRAASEKPRSIKIN